LTGFVFIGASNLSNYRYAGAELHLFGDVTNWRRYWTALIAHLTTGCVLEVGAGVGSVTVLLARDALSWTALEPDPQLLARIPPESCRRICGTLAALPAGACYDTILYADVLEHIEADQQELEAAYQRLKPGGNLIVLAPAHAWLFSPFDRAIGHYRRYNRRSLQAIRPCRSETVTMRYLDCLGMALSAANRLLLRASMPTAAQIHVWDRWVVPCSRRLDPLLGYRIGKSILVIWRKPQAAEPAALPAPAPGPQDPCR
jgi:SAM-dependent methyltransferase